MGEFQHNIVIPLVNLRSIELFYNFSGKRIKRGLYRTKNEKLVNSDINGSANIRRKSKANLFEKREVLEGQMARSKTILYSIKNVPAKHRLCLTALR